MKREEHRFRWLEILCPNLSSSSSEAIYLPLGHLLCKMGLTPVLHVCADPKEQRLLEVISQGRFPANHSAYNKGDDGLGSNKKATESSSDLRPLSPLLSSSVPSSQTIGTPGMMTGTLLPAQKIQLVSESHRSEGNPSDHERLCLDI